MEMISEETVIDVIHEVKGFSPDYAHGEMAKMGNMQPNLVAFLVEFAQDLEPGVSALSIYWLFNVCRMFQKIAGDSFDTVSHDTIVRCYEKNEALVENLEGAHDKFIERIARVQFSDQPHVMRYIVESLFDEGDEKEDIELTEDDKGYLFLLLKTVVDALNKDVCKKSNPRREGNGKDH